MTVASTTSRITYTASGSDTFAYTFRIFNKTDLVVYNDEVLQTVDVDYTVTGVGQVGGGNVVFAVAPTPGNIIIIYRELPLTQLTDYQEGDPFPAETHESALDRLCMISQQFNEAVGRMFKVPVTSLLDEVEVQEGANKFLKWNSGGTSIEANAGIPYESPAGSDKEIQFNDNGVLGADSNLTWDKINKILNVMGHNIKAYVDVGDFMDGLSGRPTYATWYANQETTDVGGVIEAALTTVAITKGTLYFPIGTYAYATSPNFARPGVNIYANQGTLFKHTGTGNAFIIDGGSAGSGILGLRFDNIIVQGNANSTNGIYVRAIHHSIFVHPRVKGAATTGSGILCEWCVLNTWIDPICSSVNGTLSPIPKYGMTISRRAVTEDSTTQLLQNPIFEGLTQANGAGMNIDWANNNVIISGTSESNTNGLIITGNGAGLNKIIGLDMEANSVNDLNLNAGGIGGANYNTFIGLYGTGLSILGNGANRNVFHGGRLDQITLDNTTKFNTFYGVVVLTTRIDNSVIGQENEWINCTAPSAYPITAMIRGGLSSGLTGPGYTTPIPINAALGNIQAIEASTGGAVTIANPTNGLRGQILTIKIRNVSGAALGVLTFDTNYRIGAAWVQPANGFSRSIQFLNDDGTKWIEIGRTAADVAN
jgi:hypothetical protein